MQQSFLFYLIDSGQPMMVVLACFLQSKRISWA